MSRTLTEKREGHGEPRHDSLSAPSQALRTGPLSRMCVALVGCFVLSACSPSSPQGGSGGAAVVAMPGGGGSGGVTDVIATGGDAPSSSCGEQSIQADQVPITLYVTIDRSGSMLDNWGAVEQALGDFVGAIDDTDYRIALNFFPTASCGPECTAQGCTTPLVEPAVLSAAAAPEDVQEKLLKEVLAAGDEGETGGTPLEPAVSGASAWIRAHLGAHPAEIAALVLVTDGKPTTCSTSVSAIKAHVNGLREDLRVPTFVIGLPGGTKKVLDELASVGGTKTPSMVSSDLAQFGGDLLAAMELVRTQAVSCQYAVPTAPAGKSVDPKQMAIDVVYEEGGAAVELEQVDSREACTVSGEGWYADNMESPQFLALCPKSCTVVRTHPKADVTVRFGCKLEAN